MNNKIIATIAVIALIGSWLSYWNSSVLRTMTGSLGSAGGMLAENYWPYLMYNDGYKSENEIVLSGADGDITTGDDLTVTDDAFFSSQISMGSSSPISTADLVIDNTGTSTLLLSSSAVNAGGCIQLEGAGGGTFKM